jgi:hypothetical protein
MFFDSDGVDSVGPDNAVPNTIQGNMNGFGSDNTAFKYLGPLRFFSAQRVA